MKAIPTLLFLLQDHLVVSRVSNIGRISDSWGSGIPSHSFLSVLIGGSLSFLIPDNVGDTIVSLDVANLFFLPQ